MKKHWHKFAAAAAILTLLWGGISAFGQEEDPALAAVDELMADRTVENCEKAIKGYLALLKDDPGNYKILYKLTNAYLAILDIKTSAMIEEKDEFKPILKELGKTACDYAERAYKINPKSKEVVGAYLVAYGYYSASFGIFKAIFKGAAGKYKKLGRELIALDDTYLDALGYRMMGSLYHMAPWPVGSSKKALQYFQKAVATCSAALHAHYYVGLIGFDKDKYDMAEKAFKIVVTNPPTDNEKHFIQAYKESARDYLKKIAKIKQKK